MIESTTKNNQMFLIAHDLFSVGCTTFLFEGKGDFRLQKKIYPAQNPNHYIESVRLIKRTSFYKCEPAIEKYGK